MIRKLAMTLAAAATFAIGAAALAPTPAAAHGWGGWGHHHRFHGPAFGFRFYSAPVSYGYAGCWRPRYVVTRWGAVRKIWVDACRY